MASVLVVQVQDFVVFRGQDHGIRECSKDFLAYPKFLLGIFILELKDLTKKILGLNFIKFSNLIIKN